MGSASKLGIILELKHEREKENLEKAAAEALAQIELKNYAAELTQRNIKNIFKLGIAFCGKNFFLAAKRT